MTAQSVDARPPVFEHMRVELLDHMGDDLTVINAARVSFSRKSDWAYLCAHCGYECSPGDYCSCSETAAGPVHRAMRMKDKDLLDRLAREGHWSPFAHPQLSFRIKVPIYVARQLIRHHVGLIWNEMSRRYTQSNISFFWPLNVEDPTARQRFEDAVAQALQAYRSMREAGVPKENARAVLPVCLMTEAVWTGSLYAFWRVFEARGGPQAQPEIRFVAWEIRRHLEQLFPYAVRALLQHSRAQIGPEVGHWRCVNCGRTVRYGERPETPCSAHENDAVCDYTLMNEGEGYVYVMP